MNSLETIVLSLPQTKRLAIHRVGHGPAVICLAGLGCDHYNFLPLVSSLAPHFTLYLIDHPGFGHSDSLERDYELKESAELVRAAIGQIGLSRYHVIGASLGGFIAQELALIDGDKISAMALLCSSSAGPLFAPIPRFEEEGLRRVAQSSEALKVEALCHPLTTMAMREELTRLREEHPCSIDEMLRQNRAAHRFLDQRPLSLASIKMPVLAFSGDSDKVVPPMNSSIFSQLLPNARTRLMKNAGHLFFMERAEECAQVLTEFFISEVNHEYRSL
jgi:pimeloyl-ACP methyl ester carboxylesterase